MPPQPRLESAKKHKDDTRYLESKTWWLGISLMAIGEVGNFMAYGFAPASTIAPLGTTTIVSNAILAPLLLKERFRVQDLAGVLLAIDGAAIVVSSSKSEELKVPSMLESWIYARITFKFFFFFFPLSLSHTLSFFSCHLNSLQLR